jgi:hypothetical protein
LIKQPPNPRKQKRDKNPPIIMAEKILFKLNPLSQRTEMEPRKPIKVERVKITKKWLRKNANPF